MMLHILEIWYEHMHCIFSTIKRWKVQHRFYICTFRPPFLPDEIHLRISNKTWILQTTIDTNLRINMAEIMGLRQQILGKIVTL